MTALIAAIFVASILGSMHCVGMCGAFLALAVAEHNGASTAHSFLQTAYHGGRLITYTTLGVMAGSIGAAMDLGGSIIGIQQTAAIVAGAAMIGFGAIALLRLWGIGLPRFPLPALLHRSVAAGHRIAFGLSPVPRALMIGLLTTLLPCGWLYAFVITAAGTAHPALGAVTMIVFWLGTLPAMISVGVGLGALTGVLRARLPYITSALIIVVGLYMVSVRLAIPTIAMAGAAAAPSDLSAAVDRVNNLGEEDLPCCHAD